MAKFKGIQCSKIHKNFSDAINNLELKEIASTPLKNGEVRIKVYASSLNYFDLLMLVGRYQVTPALPFIPGSEVSGKIIEVATDVKNLKVGDEVVVGMSPSGMATEMVVSGKICIPKPKALSHAQAAASVVGFMTAYNGLVTRGNLKKGETLLVTGAGGGMGLAAIQLGKLLGAKVIAAASSDDKLDIAKQMGADAVINYNTESLKDSLAKMTNNQYVDVCYEIVGGEIFDQCTRCMGDQGRLLVIGFASGVIPTVPANLPLVKGYSIVGVRAGESMRRNPKLTSEMFQKYLEWTTQGKLAPHVVQFQHNDYKNAFSTIADRKAIGKCVILWEEEKSKL
jgi:NADPH2:quinone reductase